MALPSATILDVGHGNSTVLHSADGIIVVDVARATSVLDFLKELGVAEIEALIISHADADHVRGLVGLFAADTITVKSVYVNPDALKGSQTWEDFRYAAKDYSKRRPKALRCSINAGDPGTLEFRDMTLNVLSPDVAIALAGVGHVDGEHTVSANDHSVVIQVQAFERSVMLLLGDVTPWAWQKIRASGINLRSDVALLPHHGGAFGRVAELEDLLATISPTYAIASNGRGMHDNPRQIVVQNVRSRGARMICTQLSSRCGTAEGGVTACAGTVAISFEGSATSFPGERKHQDFIDLIAGAPLCRL